MIWPFLALQLLLLCVENYRQVSENLLSIKSLSMKFWPNVTLSCMSYTIFLCLDANVTTRMNKGISIAQSCKINNSYF